MKKLLIAAYLPLLASIAAAQGINYYGTLFYNSTANTVTVSYWVQNLANGNKNIEIASVGFSLQYDPAVVTLQNQGTFFIPSGAKLDIASDYYPGLQDATTTSSRTSDGRTLNIVSYVRSTNICDNTIFLANDFVIPIYQAAFTLNVAPEAYDFNDPNAPNYIAEFLSDDASTPTSSDPPKAIFFVPHNSLDQAGNGNKSCRKDGTLNSITGLSDNNLPNVFVSGNAPLPVQIMAFQLTRQNDHAVLQWQAPAEPNNKGFEIQRKTNGAFETIAFAGSKADLKNELVSEYYYMDPDRLSAGTTFYRLMGISNNNQAKYSEIRAIRYTSGIFKISIYPNPNRGTFYIAIPEGIHNLQISLTDVSGRILRAWNSIPENVITLAGIKPGLYFLKVVNKDSGEFSTEKIITH